jgi:hypothetical protein
MITKQIFKNTVQYISEYDTAASSCLKKLICVVLQTTNVNTCKTFMVQVRCST